MAIGPGPFRTARGAGLFALEDERVDDEGFRRVWLPDDRVLEGAVLVPLLFRDAGGEDVRVAMVRSLSEGHTSLRCYTPGLTLRRRAFRPRGRPERDRKSKIMDPESNSANGTGYPQMKLWNLGVNLNF
jgi:hypothetical protein